MEEWGKRWPEKKRRTKLQHEKVSEFKELTLEDNEVERKITVDGDVVYAQVEFVQQLRKKARVCGDQNLMVSQGIAKLPPHLCEALGLSYVDFNTWEELVDAVMALSPANGKRLTLIWSRMAISKEPTQSMSSATIRAFFKPSINNLASP